MTALSRQRHAFVLLPQASLLALGAAGEALAAANEALDDELYSSIVVSLDGQPAATAQGIAVQVAGGLERLAACDAVHVIASLPLPEHATCRAALIERALLPLFGIGAGALVLAEAGLLEGHRASFEPAQASTLAQRHPSIVVSSHLYEIDRLRMTCGGGSAVLEMMIAWLARRHGDKLAQALVAHFGLERLRASDERPRVPAAARLGSSKLAEAVSLMEANLGEPLPTEDIARLVGVSRRQLERLFKQHLDELPSRYYAELRLARARRLLQQSNQSILQIGMACGFSSGSHFSNAYRARFGHTPREARSQRAQAWREQRSSSIGSSQPEGTTP